MSITWGTPNSPPEETPTPDTDILSSGEVEFDHRYDNSGRADMAEQRRAVALNAALQVSSVATVDDLLAVAKRIESYLQGTNPLDRV